MKQFIKKTIISQNLENCEFIDSECSNSNLDNCKISNSTLSNSNLIDCSINNSNIKNSTISVKFITLKCITFTNCTIDCQNNVFENCNFENCELINFDKITILENCNLKKSKYDIYNFEFLKCDISPPQKKINQIINCNLVQNFEFRYN